MSLSSSRRRTKNEMGREPPARSVLTLNLDKGNPESTRGVVLHVAGVVKEGRRTDEELSPTQNGGFPTKAQ